MYFIKSGICICLLVILSEPIRAKTREITVENVDIILVDKAYADFNYTLGDKTITAYLNLFKSGLEKYLDINIQLYNFEANEYRLRPMNISRNICSFLNLEWNYMKDTFSETDHIVRSCPIEKGLYYVKEYKVNPVNLPHVPWEKVMAHIKLTYKDTLIGSVKFYAKIEHHDNIPTSAGFRKSLFLNKMYKINSTRFISLALSTIKQGDLLAHSGGGLCPQRAMEENVNLSGWVFHKCETSGDIHLD
ncbi:hypothetical protein CBL_11017 [Carabus blaptoides fortunei]